MSLLKGEEPRAERSLGSSRCHAAPAAGSVSTQETVSGRSPTEAGKGGLRGVGCPPPRTQGQLFLLGHAHRAGVLPGQPSQAGRSARLHLCASSLPGHMHLLGSWGHLSCTCFWPACSPAPSKGDSAAPEAVCCFLDGPPGCRPAFGFCSSSQLWRGRGRFYPEDAPEPCPLTCPCPVATPTLCVQSP